MKPRLLGVLLWVLTHTSYKVRPLGSEHVPARGGALVVSNHISFLDALLVLSASPRFVRFLLAEEICRIWWLNPFLRWLRVIPLPPESEPRRLTQALQTAREAIERGEVVGIFAERSISRIGSLLPFGNEFERIMPGTQAPIIPVCLDGVWGSVFSYERGRFFWKLPRQLRQRVTVSFGIPLSSNSTALAVRSAIQELNTDAWPYRRETLRPLHRTFVRQARRHPFRFAMADVRTPPITLGGALVRVMLLSRRLRPCWDQQEMVGILLPPSVAGALANLAALLMGKVPVNLNYTLSPEGLASCIGQCGLKTVLTSQVFLERLKIKLPCEGLFLEQIAARPGFWERLFCLLVSFGPSPLMERLAGRSRPGNLDDLATVIFSSGSTGDPKGVLLTHYNIASNTEQMAQVLRFDARDRFLGILPFFHSFGFTATLIAPLSMGIGVAYHASPLEARPIAELVRRYAVTHLMTTPTFLQIYLRNCEPGDFGSLRCVMAAAEKLPEWLASAFEEKFGIRPWEGYGCTECSPVIACSTQDFRAPGFRQLGTRRSSIGRPLPGVSLRIVDPDTEQAVEPGNSGLLLVRGPNVMKGYLGQPEKTAAVLRDGGWYVTGDIASADEDGFVHITDRLSRFSKIGGEMVPHIRVEEKLHEAAGVTEITFAVTGAPDPKKGERLVVLHTLPEERLPEVLRKLPALGLPNLWIPKAGQCVHVDELPRLATGKMDLRQIRALAVAACAAADSIPE